MYLHMLGLRRQTVEGVRTDKALEKAVSIYLQYIITKPCHSLNLVYPPHSVPSVGSVPTAPQGD